MGKLWYYGITMVLHQKLWNFDLLWKNYGTMEQTMVLRKKPTNVQWSIDHELKFTRNKWNRVFQYSFSWIECLAPLSFNIIIIRKRCQSLWSWNVKITATRNSFCWLISSTIWVHLYVQSLIWNISNIMKNTILLFTYM